MLGEIYEYKENLYVVDSVTHLKFPKLIRLYILIGRFIKGIGTFKYTGKPGWVEGVIYRDAESDSGRIYTRELHEFKRKFKPWKDHNVLELPLGEEHERK